MKEKKFLYPKPKSYIGKKKINNNKHYEVEEILSLIGLTTNSLNQTEKKLFKEKNINKVKKEESISKIENKFPIKYNKGNDNDNKLENNNINNNLAVNINYKYKKINSFNDKKYINTNIKENNNNSDKCLEFYLEKESNIKKDILINSENIKNSNLYVNSSSDNEKCIEDKIIKKNHTYIGLPNKKFFYNLSVPELNKLQNYIIEEVEKDGNCGYRAISLQIYNDENNYNIIRTHVYTFLNTNLDFYKDKYTTLYNEAIKAVDYIPYVKGDGFWMGDLELSVINLIYDINLLIFEININTRLLNLLNIYSDFNDKSKNILT